ncbi:MAG: M23 family metallopeptidase [Flavobacteriales bacterium]|nr:M23 family metallopeptidase [Flavobacteriales bacterium]
MRKGWIILLLTVSCFFLCSSDISGVEKRTGLDSPLKIALNLSGNFGEFRSNHFHAGIDIKTQGKTGLPVYTAAEGFVSRIKISPYGYGNAVYIDHPNGLTTVYGHLQKLDSTIAAFTQAAQYDMESFYVDLYPNPEALPISRGQEIGKSGNSGSSGGPHLHFEVRQTETEFPLNPLLWNFPVKDKRKPELYELRVYPLGPNSKVEGKSTKKGYRTNANSGSVRLQKKTPIVVSGEVAFGLHALDFLDNNSNRCGIYQLEVKVNGKREYLQQIDQLDFEIGRMMNAHVEYPSFKREKKSIHRAFRLPYNELPIYKDIKGNGSFVFEPDSIYDVEMIATDAHGNSSKLQFQVKGEKVGQSSEVKPDSTQTLFEYNKVNTLRTERCNLFLPEGRLYDDTYIDIQKREKRKSEWSGLYRIGDTDVPLHDYFLGKIKLDSIPEGYEDKLMVMKYLAKRNRSYNQGGDVKMGWITFRSKSFGSFYVAMDTIPPRVQIKSQLTAQSRGKVEFKVTDDLSGIQHYDAYLNGKWILLSWEPKRARMWLNLDELPNAIKESGNELKLVIEDERGNISTKLYSF